MFVGVPRLFTRPLRLTAPEGFALLAAGRAAMQLPGADPDGPLGRALDKLAAALGDEPDRRRARRWTWRRPPLVDVLVAAAADGERLRIRYWTASRDEVTERTIAPRRVFHERGHWYVSADDERSGEERTFRVDRIEQLDRTGEIVPRAGDAEPLDRAGGRSVAWISDGSVPRVTLRLRPARPVGRRALPGRPCHRARRRRRRRGAGGDQRAVAGAAAVACRHRRRGARPGGMASISGATGRADCSRATPPRRRDRGRRRGPPAAGRGTAASSWASSVTPYASRRWGSTAAVAAASASASWCARRAATP